jgi:transposase-like protein
MQVAARIESIIAGTSSPEKELTMSLSLNYNDPCPRCGKMTVQSEIEPHPSRTDIAIQRFRCADCGPVKTKVLSLLSHKQSTEIAIV